MSLDHFRSLAARHFGRDIRTLSTRPDPRVEALARFLREMNGRWDPSGPVGALPTKGSTR